MNSPEPILLCDLVQSYAPQSGGVKRYVHDKMRFFDTLPQVSHLLLEAVRMLHEAPETARPVRQVCIGEGEYAGEVEEAAAASACIHRLPYVSNQKDLARWYAGADLFAHAGDKETFGLVSVEAQACGTRVLAVRDGGMDTTLQGEKPLIMAESPEPQKLARAMTEIMQLDPELEKGERAKARRQRIQRHFSRHSSFCKLLGLYRHLAAGEPASSFHDEFAWDPACERQSAPEI